MPLIKICGLRRYEDICYANEFFPDYIGFVFSKSRRQVAKEFARELGCILDPKIKKVGVFVNEQPEEVINIAEFCSLDCIQLHGDETNDYIRDLKNLVQKRSLNLEIWKSFKIKNTESLKELESFEFKDIDGILLDTFVEGSYGGTGKSFDWNIARQARKFGKIILAGGLNSENIIEAIKQADPMVVDVSSGVETNGFKDREKIKAFINSIKCLK